jgi:uncharacterized protein (TIGR00251 family)
MRLAIRVRPRSSTPKVGGEHDGALVVRVAAAPVDGKANTAVATAVAKAFGVPARQVRLVSGARSANKLLEVDGNESELQKRLEALLADSTSNPQRPSG